MPKPIIFAEVMNLVIIIIFDYSIYHFWGFKAIAYIFLSTILGLGLHPMSGHFVGEHYEIVKGQETIATMDH